MNELLETKIGTLKLDKIPQGTFYAITEPDQVPAIRLGIQLGRKIQELFPEVADKYRNGKSQSQLANEYNITQLFGVGEEVAREAIRHAICGYDGSFELIDEPPYAGLITDKTELERIAREHNVQTGKETGTRMLEECKGIFALTKEKRSEIGRKSGKAQYKKGIGIHAQTVEDRRRIGRLGVSALGYTPFKENQLQDLYEKSQMPQYSRRSRINAVALAKYANEIYHGGHNVWTPRSIVKAFSRYSKRVKKS